MFIFSYNLSETIESIKTSLSYQPVQTVMTREMELEYDRKLIQDIKQTSLDMVGHLAPTGSDIRTCTNFKIALSSNFHNEHSGKSGTIRESNQASGVRKAHYA